MIENNTERTWDTNTEYIGHIIARYGKNNHSGIAICVHKTQVIYKDESGPGGGGAGCPNGQKHFV